MPLSHIFAAILINAGWGGNFVAVRVGGAEVSPIFFAALRFIIMMLILLPWLRWKTGLMKPVLIGALFGGALHFSAIYVGTTMLGHAASASFLSQLVVPFSMLLAVIILKETIGKWRIFGVALSFVGVGILSFDPGIGAHIEGALWIIWAQFSYAVSAICLKKVRGMNVLEMQAWIAALCAPGLLVLSLVFEDNQLAQLDGMTVQGWSALAYTIIVSSIIGHGGVYYLYQRYPVSTVMPFFLLSPVFATVGGVLLLGEELTLRMLLGGIVISGGVGLIVFRDKLRQKKVIPIKAGV